MLRTIASTASATSRFAGLGRSCGEPANPLAPKAAHFTATAKRVIFLFMQGGPSHLDTFDYKPKLQADDGKPFNNSQALRLTVEVRAARPERAVDQRAVSRTWPNTWTICACSPACTPTARPTARASLFMHTGHTQQVRPSLGSWTLYGLGSETADLPGFIAMNPAEARGAIPRLGVPARLVPGHLRPARAARRASSRCRTSPRTSPPISSGSQLDLMRRVNAGRLALDEVNSELEGVIESYELAFRMQSAVPSLMDLSSESPATLSMYGIGRKETDDFGRQCLLARRFAEAGVRFIEIGTAKWDHHVDLQAKHAQSAREVDQPIAALLTDLKQRGLLKDTLVVWGGEFGRTPVAQNGNGRDHNNRGFTMWMAGGGVKAGIRHGATDEYGREAVEQRVHIHDLHATILHCSASITRSSPTATAAATSG